MGSKVLIVAICVLLTSTAAAAAAQRHDDSNDTTTTSSSMRVLLDGAKIGGVYDGHGALSAGASSRLLQDYPSVQRAQILDYLFKPNFGASLHMIKVEIGGDTQSTDGTEPSYMHSRGDNAGACERGYEAWLLQEARARNPKIKTYALSWGVPAWVGNGSYFSADNVAYQVGWVECIRSKTGIEIQYLGIWNERAWGTPSYVSMLRNALDEAGFENTMLILPDGISFDKDLNTLLSDLNTNETFRNNVAGVGLHYPCQFSHLPKGMVEELQSLDKLFWSSEDYSTVGDWAGAGCWGRLLNQNYVRMNQTSTIAWSLIWSVYPTTLPYYGNGLMYAYEPWSGHYTVNMPIWTSAHVTQAVEPGWEYLAVGSGSGLLTDDDDDDGDDDDDIIMSIGVRSHAANSNYNSNTARPLSPPLSSTGSYVTMRSPDGQDFSLIMESLQGACLRCPGNTPVSKSRNITFEIMPNGGSGLLPTHVPLRAWVTTSKNGGFRRDPSLDIHPPLSTFTVSLPPDAMITLTTRGTLSRAGEEEEVEEEKKRTVPAAADADAAVIPPSSPFPFPYTDTFDGYDTNDTLARYFADQGGSFSVFHQPEGEEGGGGGGGKGVNGGVLRQCVPLDPGPNAWVANPNPITMLGSANWTDYTVSINATLRLAEEDEGDSSGASNTFFEAGVRLGKITGWSPWQEPRGNFDGYFCRIYGNGTVSLFSRTKSLNISSSSRVSGPAGGVFNPRAWHRISVSAQGNNIRCALNGRVVATGIDGSCKSGMVTIGTGWHLAEFDDLEIVGTGPGGGGALR